MLLFASLFCSKEENNGGSTRQARRRKIKRMGRVKVRVWTRRGRREKAWDEYVGNLVSKEVLRRRSVWNGYYLGFWMSEEWMCCCCCCWCENSSLWRKWKKGRRSEGCCGCLCLHERDERRRASFMKRKKEWQKQEKRDKIKSGVATKISISSIHPPSKRQKDVCVCLCKSHGGAWPWWSRTEDGVKKKKKKKKKSSIGQATVRNMKKRQMSIGHTKNNPSTSPRPTEKEFISLPPPTSTSKREREGTSIEHRASRKTERRQCTSKQAKVNQRTPTKIDYRE